MSTQTDFAALFPDEVVTEARTRLLDVPGLRGKLALITIDNGHDHTKPSTFGPGGLTSLNTALDEAFAAEPAAIRDEYGRNAAGQRMLMARRLVAAGVRFPPRRGTGRPRDRPHGRAAQLEFVLGPRRGMTAR